MRPSIGKAMNVAGVCLIASAVLMNLTFLFDPMLSLRFAYATLAMALVLFGFIGYALLYLCWAFCATLVRPSEPPLVGK
ncbi:MAG TPA: hypothetical protein VFP46_00560 [Candidatus Paceibacterota bacterium]|nr:hypothetical protein [Candidatus Paceibacterota bacterium]